jgi:hypothetical protein
MNKVKMTLGALLSIVLAAPSFAETEVKSGLEFVKLIKQCNTSKEPITYRPNKFMHITIETDAAGYCVAMLYNDDKSAAPAKSPDLGPITCKLSQDDVYLIGNPSGEVVAAFQAQDNGKDPDNKIMAKAFKPLDDCARATLNNKIAEDNAKAEEATRKAKMDAEAQGIAYPDQAASDPANPSATASEY